MLKRPWILAGVALAALLFLIGLRFIGPRSNILLPQRASNGAEYILYVHVPERCKSGGCPALYILDGGRWLPTFAELTEDAAARHAMAPLILVGIGYRAIPGISPQRQRDFTPGPGADAFIGALQRDIIPYAQAHLPISDGRRGIVANGEAGSLAAYALAHAPDLFDAYLITNPSAVPAAPFAPSAKPHAVLLAAASPEVQRMRQLGGALLRDPNVSVSQSLYPNKTGDAIVEPAAQAGLPIIFPDE